MGKSDSLKEENMWNHFFLEGYRSVLFSSVATTVIKTVWYWHKNRNMEQDRNSRDKSTHLWSPYFWQGGKNIECGKDSLLNKWCWENSAATCERMKLEHFLTLYTKINSRWINDLNVGPETIKLFRDNIGKTLWHKSQQAPLWPTSQSNGNKNKNKQMGPN